MSKNLLIVESPTKVKTIKKYLGPDFEVLASYGHVRNLAKKKGVDPDKHFALHYQSLEKSSKHIDAIAKALQKADALYLATDPDREGEAIAWHVWELLKNKKGLNKKSICRVVFNEITKTAVNDALAKPRDLAMDLVNAQQARSALDYLVGFNLSPQLWKKVRSGLSAGRVQSPALRMIVEREEEIERFVAREYWTLTANLQTLQQKLPPNFSAKLITYQGEKLSQFTITEDGQAHNIRDQIWKQAQGQLQVSHVSKKQRKRNPAAPFTTSTLQQEAARKIGFTAQRTMRIAQQLYEGVDIGSGAVGLITYMRTDSVHLASEALHDIRQFIQQQFGQDRIPEAPRQYRTKSKNAQEAHEAIRPTSVALTPEKVKAYLSPEQFKLYELIWKRTVACQMIPATINMVAIDLTCGDGHVFRANGSTIIDPGFIAVYQEDLDDTKQEDENGLLPALEVGEKVNLLELNANQHFTEPPPRFSEASLVKALEEYGIGRPSTYASIISTIQQREYVVLVNKRFQPTDVGRIVNRFLTQHFYDYVDYDFTARLEDQLDAVARGEKPWLALLEEFWQPFTQKLSQADENVQRKDIVQESLTEACPDCGSPLAIRLGKRGRFIACTAYPNCKYTRNLVNEQQVESESQTEIVADRSCPQCSAPLQIKQGRYGKFIGCSRYPECKHMEPLQKPADTGVSCPKCQQGSLLKRRSRGGKIFYSCSTYPKCDYAIWNEPLNEPCPKCNWPILTRKITQRKGTEKVCPQKDCNYAGIIEETK
jgi:DNA topoisomerase-1